MTGSVSVRSIRQDQNRVAIMVQSGDQIRELRAERLLVATGRKPNSGKIVTEL